MLREKAAPDLLDSALPPPSRCERRGPGVAAASGAPSRFPSEPQPHHCCLREVWASRACSRQDAPPALGSGCCCGCDGAADRGGSSPRRSVLARMVITVSRQALSEGGGDVAQGCAAVVGESQTRRSRGVRVQEGPTAVRVPTKGHAHTCARHTADQNPRASGPQAVRAQLQGRTLAPPAPPFVVPACSRGAPPRVPSFPQTR